MSSEGKIKVVVIDDNEEIRFIIREVLSDEDQIQIIGEAHNMQEGRKKIQNKPDIAIIDLSLDEPKGGLKLLDEIKKANLLTQTIIVTAHDETFAPICYEKGARGYLSKDKIVSDLASAIIRVRAGETYPKHLVDM